MFRFSTSKTTLCFHEKVRNFNPAQPEGPSSPLTKQLMSN